MYFFVTILLVSTALATSGCFLEPQSDYYCQEIEQTEADFECSLFDDCSLESSFIEDESCKYFTECEQILCQSNCQTMPAGLCESGEVPAGEEDLWCQSVGCCQYYIEGAEAGCQIEENKWYCHIAASNAGAETLNWDQSLTQTSCEDTCIAESYPYQTELSNPDIDYYSDNVIEESSIESKQEVLGSETNISKDQGITQKIIKILGPIFLLFIISLLSIFFYEHRFTIIKDYKMIEKRITKNKRSKKSSKNSNKQEDQNSFNSDHQMPKSKSQQLLDQVELIAKIKPHRSHHAHVSKRIHAKLELTESFSGYQESKLETKSSISKLAHLAKKYQRKLKRKEKYRKRLNDK